MHDCIFEDIFNIIVHVFQFCLVFCQTDNDDDDNNVDDDYDDDDDVQSIRIVRVKYVDRLLNIQISKLITCTMLISITMA